MSDSLIDLHDGKNRLEPEKSLRTVQEIPIHEGEVYTDRNVE